LLFLQKQESFYISFTPVSVT